MATGSDIEPEASTQQPETPSELPVGAALPPHPSLPPSDALPLLPSSRDAPLLHDTSMADDPPIASTSTSTSSSHPSILKNDAPAPTLRARAGRRSVTFLPEQAPARVVVPAAEPARQFSEEEVAAWRSTQVDARQAEVRWCGLHGTRGS